MPTVEIDDVQPTARLLPDREVEIDTPISPGSVPLNLQQEWARRWIAFSLIFIFGLEVIAALISWVGRTPSPETKEILEVIFGPTVALVASATGFYFGTKP